MKTAVFFANGTEELEALTCVDVLRRTGATCDIVSVSGEYPKGAHGIVVKADMPSEECDFDQYDALIVPGGMPGAVNIAEDQYAVAGLKKAVADKKLIAAICAAPAVVLASHGLIKGRKATCYPVPDFIAKLKDCEYTGLDVQTDGNYITANGPKSAFAFSMAICEYLGLTAKF